MTNPTRTTGEFDARAARDAGNAHAETGEYIGLTGVEWFYLGARWQHARTLAEIEAAHASRYKAEAQIDKLDKRIESLEAEVAALRSVLAEALIQVKELGHIEINPNKLFEIHNLLKSGYAVLSNAKERGK